MSLLSWKLLTMACMRDLCIRHELIYGTLLSESISTLRLYFGSTGALVDERWESFFNIRALNETFYRYFTWLNLSWSSIHLWSHCTLKAYWVIMRLSTSDILRLKQPFTTIIEHVEKVDLFDLTGRITDACFENVYMHIQKKYLCG